MDNAVHTQQTCKNCGNSFAGKYCNACGEKVYGPHDRSVVYILEEALHFITHFEGSFLTTVKTIFTKPGKLSLDYCNGIRKKYYKPVTMFFFLIVIYLLLPGMFPKGLDMELRYYKGQASTQNYVTQKIEQKMAQRHITEEQLTELYAHKSHTVSKFMLFIILPICAVVLWGLFPRGRPFFDHFMLSTEVNAFFLTAFFMLLPLLLGVGALAVMFIGTHVFHASYAQGGDVFSEGTMMLINTVLFGVFCTVCFHRFYGASYLVSVLKTIVFVLLQYITVFILYKIILFTTVMWLI